MSRILVIDDEQVFRELFQELLEEEGFEVETAIDGEMALPMISKGGYDLILLDVIMPKIDGITLLRKLQNNNPEIPNGPIYMLSVLEESDFIKTCLMLGAAGYINKSLGTPKDIVEKVKKLIKED